MAKILVRTQPLEVDVPYQDGDHDRILVKKVIKSIDTPYTIWHRLGRTPRKAFVVASIGGYISCRISLQDNGTEQSDNEKITLEFSAAGTATICIE